MALELLDLPTDQGVLSERAVANALAEEGGDLRFNGAPIAEALERAVGFTKGCGAVRLLDGPHMRFGFQIDVAVYHPDEGAIYVGLTYRVKTSDRIVESGGSVIRKGEAHGAILVSHTSFDTAAGIQEWMNSLDLRLIAGLGTNWV